MTTPHVYNTKYSAHVHCACPRKNSQQHLEMFSNLASARLSSNQTRKLKLKCVLLYGCTTVYATDCNGNLLKANWSHPQQLIKSSKISLNFQHFWWTKSSLPWSGLQFTALDQLVWRPKMYTLKQHAFHAHMSNTFKIWPGGTKCNPGNRTEN
jgi:hypothetical protein